MFGDPKIRIQIINRCTKYKPRSYPNLYVK